MPTECDGSDLHLKDGNSVDSSVVCHKSLAFNTLADVVEVYRLSHTVELDFVVSAIILSCVIHRISHKPMRSCLCRQRHAYFKHSVVLFFFGQLLDPGTAELHLLLWQNNQNPFKIMPPATLPQKS